ASAPPGNVPRLPGGCKAARCRLACCSLAGNAATSPGETLSLAFQMRRLVRHSAIYGLGGILSRLLAVLLLPLYTSYLGTKGFGKIEIVTALTTVLVIVLGAGISSAFFRFYFDSKDDERRTLIVRTTFWFTMAMATFGLVVGCAFAGPISHLLKL